MGIKGQAGKVRILHVCGGDPMAVFPIAILH